MTAERFDEIKALEIRHKTTLFDHFHRLSRAPRRHSRAKSRIIAAINPIYLHYQSECLFQKHLSISKVSVDDDEFRAGPMCHPRFH